VSRPLTERILELQLGILSLDLLSPRVAAPDGSAVSVLGELIPVFLLKDPVMLATLSFLIIVDADVLTICSFRGLSDIPGYGKISRLQTCVKSVSRRILSFRVGANTGTLVFVVRRDCDRLI
jgi:hypothetical protein